MIDFEPLHFSKLKELAKSGQHFVHAAKHGREDTASMRVGRAAHSLLLGGADVLVYSHRRYGKDWDDFRAEHQSAEILSTAEYTAAQGAAESLRSHTEAFELIRGAWLREYSFDWFRAGFRCSGRADFVRPGAYLGDLKVCRSAHPERFGRQAIQLAYHAQMAWYGYGLEQNGLRAPEAYLVAVESAPPHPVVIRRLTPQALQMGDRLCLLWLEQLRGFLASDKWPGYAETVLDLDCEPELELQFPEDDEAEAA